MRDWIANRAANPLLATQPEWVEGFRPQQVKAIWEIGEMFNSGVDVVVLDAPPGSGKTLIGETVGRMLRQKTTYICTSKSLQDQFVGDFPYAKVLKGRANYPTELYASSFHPERWVGHVSCDDCTWSQEKRCGYCEERGRCPYVVAKKAAAMAGLSVLNTSYFLAEANTAGMFSKQSFVVADECDLLEGSLMGYVSVEVGERRVQKWKWDPPKKVTVQEAWREWVEEKVVELRRRVKGLPETFEDVRGAREAKYVTNLLDGLRRVKAGLESDKNTWVYTGREGHGISFRPSRVDDIGEKVLWRHGDKWLLMSGTVISGDEIVDSLGYQGGWGLVKVQNTFRKENRRVVVDGVANNTRGNQGEAWPKIVKKVREIVEEEKEQNVLVHAVSYALTKQIADGLRGCGRDVWSYGHAAEKEMAIESFTTKGGVLVAPSLERGIDLPDELCRVQIVVKVPYPYLGDRQVSARLHSKGGQLWYNVQAVRSVVQMCGRGVRHEEDYAVTYIVDSQFKERLWNSGRGLFPEWFKEGLEWK